MRTLALILLSMFLGLALGAGTTWARYGWFRTAPVATPGVEGNEPDTLASDTYGGKLIVDEEEHNFGAVERDSSTRYAFIFRNIGAKPLRLQAGASTCGKCTISDLRKKILKPGESGEVGVEYKAIGDEPYFRQSVTIHTSDPDRPDVTLKITGKITTSIRGKPTTVVFSNVSANETKTAEMKVFAYLTDRLEIKNPQFTDDQTKNYFAVELSAIPRDKLDDRDAKSGVLVAVTVKPGLPLGPIVQKLRLETNVPGKQIVDIPIQGTVVSDISLAGPGWDRTRGRLALGTVDSREGIRRELILLIRGPHRHKVQFSLDRSDPSMLGVHFGKPGEINDGAVVQVPLTIEISPGSPAENRLGSNQSDLGHIWINTTHPQVKQIRVDVKFAVEGS